MVEWFTEHPPGPGSSSIFACIWMAVKREIEERRAEVPEDLKEKVAGVLLAYRLQHTIPGNDEGNL